VLPAFQTHILILVFLTGTGAVGWNIIGGFGGQFSLGNAMFFGVGGYTTAILLVDHGVSGWVGMAVGVLLAVALAVAVGYPSFLLSGHYFALATIAVVEGLWFLSLYFDGLTGGSRGYSVAVEPSLASMTFGSRASYFYLAYALFLAAVLVSIRIRNSKLGYYLLAIRENQDAAQSLGIDATKYKMYGFVVSAVLTAMAGSLYAVYLQFLFPEGMFSLDESIVYALTALVGGLGTVAGPILGTFLIVPLEQYVTTVLGARTGALSYVGYGLVLILVIMYAPGGLVSQVGGVTDRIEAAFPTFGDPGAGSDGGPDGDGGRREDDRPDE